MLKININFELLRKCEPAFKIVRDDVKDDYREASGGDINNGESAFLWNRRLNEWIKIVSRDLKNYIQISIDRMIWKTVAVLDEEGILWLLTSRQNFRNVQTKVKNGNVTHYMYLLTATNPDGVEQLSFNVFDEKEKGQNQRLERAKEILGDEFSKVKQTQIITYEYTPNVALKGSIFLVDNQFNIIEEQAISDLIDTDNLKIKVGSSTHSTEKENTDSNEQLVSWKNDPRDDSNSSEEVIK